MAHGHEMTVTMTSSSFQGKGPHHLISPMDDIWNPSIHPLTHSPVGVGVVGVVCFALHRRDEVDGLVMLGVAQELCDVFVTLHNELVRLLAVLLLLQLPDPLDEAFRCHCVSNPKPNESREVSRERP
uniref:Uncharacterized protein n=1 Tax=Chloropicon primus TaxID=1764295 RepID=A0A7S2SWQ1_9CHLO